MQILTHRTRHNLKLAGSGTLLLLAALYLNACRSGPELQHWHKEVLEEEFTAQMSDREIHGFADYLALEERLFRELDERIYAKTDTGPAHVLQRYSRGSAADPESRTQNWNRSFELSHDKPVGQVLLLHGMSDSPYSLRALGVALHQRGYRILGLRLPGHGTAPSGLRAVTWRDMAAAVKLAMRYLQDSPQAVHIIGYSTGASLALDYSLWAMASESNGVPASLVLVSPAIRVHPASALAGFKNSLAVLPGLDAMAWLTVMEEFDPFKYNSFATNAGAQVHAITREVDRRIQTLSGDPAAAGRLPPILVLKSTVDSTVTTEAVVDNLLMRLPAHRNELVLFDVNRNAAVEATLLVSDPGPLTRRLFNDPGLPFTVTFVTNESSDNTRVVARYNPSLSADEPVIQALGLDWPRGVVSLSHVAVPFPPDDPLYGRQDPQEEGQIFLGDLAIKGETGLLKLPAGWLLRMRYNPFYAYMQTRIVDWVDEANTRSSGGGVGQDQR